MADFKYYGANYIYVDAGLGNDANAGTAAAPKRTVLAAIGIASNNDTIIVGTGSYDYIEPIGGISQGLSIIGDGFVLFDGTSAAVGNAVKEVLKIKNITFYNYNSTGNANAAIEFTNLSNNNPMEVQNCNFYGCDFVNSRNSFNYIKDSIFQDCIFDGVIGAAQLQGAIQNCTFVSCSGQLGDAETMTYGVFNNTYTDCIALTHTLLTGAVPKAIPLDKFNYCNIDGKLMHGTQAQIQLLGTNIFGSSFASSVIFNDYVDNGTRPIADWWKQSYTQKLNSPTLTTGRNGTHIGRYFKSFYTNAVDIWNNSINDNNLQLSTDVIEVFVAGSPAFYEGDTLGTGGVGLSKLIMNANYTYGANGEITEYIFQRDNIAPQQKSSVNLGIATVDQIDATTFLPIDNYWYNGYGAALATAPPYTGTADTNYISIGEEFNGKKVIKSNTVHLRFELKTL